MANSINREAIYAAFFALMSGSATFKTKSRLLRLWSDVDSAYQPALFQTQVREMSKADRTGIPNIWTFHVLLHVYVHVGQQQDEGVSPATIMNPILDTLCDLIQPGTARGEQTLGGLVTMCRIAGEIMLDEGFFGPQGIAQIPVDIIVAGNA